MNSHFWQHARQCMTSVVLIGLVIAVNIPGTAEAASCQTDGDELFVSLPPGTSAALRMSSEDGDLQFVEGAEAEELPAGAAAWQTCGSIAQINAIWILGTVENDRLILVADSRWDHSTVVTRVDLAAGGDFLRLIPDPEDSQASLESIFARTQTALSDAEVVSLSASDSDSDMELLDAEQIEVVGGPRPDSLTASGLTTTEATFGEHSIPAGTANFARTLVFDAQEGDDLFRPSDTDDVYLGASGQDTVDYFGAVASVDVALNRNEASGGSGSDSLEQVESATGSFFGDFLTGDDGTNVLLGMGSNDVIFGGPGDDFLSGGLGHDHLKGEYGNDTIDQGDTKDGSDFVSGGPGKGDLADYGKRTERVMISATGSDRQPDCDDGEAREHDCIFSDIERVKSGLGEGDVLRGGSGPDRLNGGKGNDEIYGGPGPDQINGGDGNDRLWGGGGNDRISGDSGHDFASGGTGHDKVHGGSLSGQGATVGAPRNSRWAGSRKNAGPERARTPADGNDIVRGDAGNDDLWGGSGRDRLLGRGGSDELRGGPPARGDYCAGGPGKDEQRGCEIQPGRQRALGATA